MPYPRYRLQLQHTLSEVSPGNLLNVVSRTSNIESERRYADRVWLAADVLLSLD